MRIAVVSDVHANLPALTAVGDALAREKPDACLCPGDLVGYGPHPNECVALVRELGWTCVAGNHDLIAIGELGVDRCDGLARETLAWTRSAITDATASALRELPATASAGPVLVTHGALGDPQRYVNRDADAAQQLEQVATEHPDTLVLVLGHTHRPLAYAENGGALLRDRAATVDLPPGRVLLNPGSVGQSRSGPPLARFLLLDLEARRVEFRALEYDVRATRRALRREGLPANAVAPNHASAPRRAAARLRRRLEVRR